MTNSGRKGKQNSASADRRRVRLLEDALALLLDVDQARITIKRAAWETGQSEIYQASERQRAALAKLKAALSERWHYLMSDLEENT
jgi:hypothetical protein